MADLFPNLGENFHPIYHTSPLTLQELASMRIAMCIWVAEFNRCKSPRMFTFSITDQTCLRMLRSSKFFHNIARKFIKMIHFCIDHVEKEMTSWYNTSRNHLHLFDNICNRFDLVVLGGNGTVHVQATIAKFFEDDFFNEKSKFEIACWGCVEDKVNFYWPLVREKFDVESFQFDRDSMVFSWQLDRDLMLRYWICRKTDGLNRIPLKDFDRIEHLMIAKCCRNRYYFAVEYFLNLLHPHDRLDQVNQMLQFRGFECVEYLLPRLESRIQHHVIATNALSIFTKFIDEEDERNVEYAVQTWLHVSDSFTPERFYEEVVKRLVKNHERPLATTLAAIWSNTPYHLKEYTLENHLRNILTLLMVQKNHSFRYCDREIETMLAIMSDVEIPFGKRCLEKNWQKWIELVPPCRFNELLETCLVQRDAISNFKKYLTSTQLFQKYCTDLMNYEMYTELNEILNNLPLKRGEIFNLKKQLLESKDVHYFQSDEHRKIHAKYIDGVFSGNEALSQDFKENWLLSDEMWGSYIGNPGAMYTSAKTMISLFVSSIRQAECKNKLLEVFRNQVLVAEIPYHDDALKPFLLWCMDDDAQRVDQFFTSLPIHRIFDVILSKEVRFRRERDPNEYRNFPRQRYDSDLNKFLKWYFKSKPMFENFKRKKIEYYERMGETKIMNKFGKSKSLVIEVLREGLLMNNEIPI